MSYKNFWDKIHPTQDSLNKRLDDLGIKHEHHYTIDIGNGWVEPIFKGLEEMIAAGWDRELVQIKQKFCECRIYVHHDVSNKVQEILNKVQALCSTLCEFCGKPHGLEIPHMGRAFCRECDLKIFGR